MPTITPEMLQERIANLRSTKPAPQPASSVAPQSKPSPGSRVQTLAKKFENVVHPYSKVGGNLAGNNAINRPAVTAPANENKLIAPKPILRPSLPIQLLDELKAKFAVRAEQKKLMQEAELRRKQIEEDAILAAKLQQEEQAAIDSKQLASKAHSNKVTPNALSVGSSYRHLTEMFKFKALRPQGNTSFTRPLEQFVQEAKKASQPKMPGNEHPLNQFAMLMYIETHSLQLTATMNGFVLQQVSHAMFLGISGNRNDNQLHVQMAAARFASETTYDSNGLRNHSMFSYAQTNKSFSPKPSMGGASKLLDDMQNEMPSRSAIKAR